MIALVPAGVACSHGGAVTSAPAPSTCADVKSPATPLVIQLSEPPSSTDAECVGKVYDNIVAPAWPDLPNEVHAVDPADRLWQTRSLQYGFTPCAGCPRPGLDPVTVRRDHPDWILKDADGADVHPPGHPDWIMYDISNFDYLAAWADAVVKQLVGSGWAGVFLVDADNRPAWVRAPIDPATNGEMTASDHASYLAAAMAEVRAGLKTQGNLSVVADNVPSTIRYPDQIGSADAVTEGRGFARLTGPAWLSLYGYFEIALDKRVSSWVWDSGSLDHAQRVFGLASYLLISDALFSAYGVDHPGSDARLYDLDPGVPSDPAPVVQNGVYVRTFEHGEVAVNPGALPADVQLASQSQPITMPPGGALIEANGKVTASFP